MCKHNDMRTFIFSTSGPVQNSLAQFQNRKYWIIHNCLISNRFFNAVGKAQYSKSNYSLPSLAQNSEPHTAIFTYTMRNEKILRSQTQSTAASDKALLLFWSFAFKSKNLSLLIKTKDMYFLWTATVALAITNSLVVWESLRNGNSLDMRTIMSSFILCTLVCTSLLVSAVGHLKIRAFVQGVWTKCKSVVYLSTLAPRYSSIDDNNVPYFTFFHLRKEASTLFVFQQLSSHFVCWVQSSHKVHRFTPTTFLVSVYNANLHGYIYTSCLCTVSYIHIFLITLEDGYSWIAESCVSPQKLYSDLILAWLDRNSNVQMYSLASICRCLPHSEWEHWQ